MGRETVPDKPTLAPGRGLWLFVAAYLATHLAAAIVFVLCFHYPPRLIPLHLAVTSALLGGLFILTGIIFSLAAKRSRTVARFCAAALFTLYAFVALVFYLANFGTNFGFGSHVTLTLLRAGGRHMAGLSDAFPGFGRWLTIGLLGAATVLAVTCTFIATSIEPAFAWIFESESVRGRVRRGAIIAAFLTYLAFLIFSIISNVEESGMGIWEGEPIVSLLYDEAGRFHSTPERVAIAARERLIRRTYARGLTFLHRNIIVIVVDDLRAVSLPAYGYQRPTTPFLQSLQDQGRLLHVDWASSPCPESVCGIMSVFTSRDYSRMSLSALGLHSLLHDQGYRVSFLLSGDHRWYGLSGFYGADIDRYRDGRSDCPFGINDDRCVLHFLDELPPADGTPQIIGMHLMSAHMAGVQLPEWERFQPASRMRMPTVHGGHDEVVNGYDNGVMQADHYIAEIFARLKEKRILDDALVFITADHGEGLGEHGVYGHTTHLYQELIRVPLFIYGADPARIRNRTFAASLDIAPTVLALLGLPIPETWQGISLTEPEPAQRITFHQTTGNNPLHAVLRRDAVGYFSTSAALLRMAAD